MKEQLPGRDKITSQAKVFYDEVMLKASEKIKCNMTDGVCIAVDYGNVKESHFALHLSFIEMTNNKWKLVCLPLGFRATYEAKNADELYRLVRDILHPFGFSSLDLKKCFLCADGASYNRSAGEDPSKFTDYIRCISHSVHLIFQRSLAPYKQAPLGDDDLSSIVNARRLIMDVRTLCFALKSCHELCENVKVPDPGTETRWLTYYKCVCDFLEFISNDEEYDRFLTPVLRNGILEMKQYLPQLWTIKYVFRLLPEHIIKFQAINRPIIQHCVPSMNMLKDDFFTKEHSVDAAM